ncbi:MAG: sugar transferase [Deltaproteobacteria bacterium]|nr:sugar transferase [Deltaproteobacteria bacterium]
MYLEKQRLIRNVTTIADLVATILVFLFAFWIRNAFSGDDPADFLSHMALLPLVLAIWSFFLSYYGAYRSPRECSTGDYAWSTVRAVAAGLALLLTLLFLLKIQYVSRIIVVIFSGLNTIALFVIRLWVVRYYRESLKDGESYMKVLIIGTGSRAMRLSRTLQENTHWGLNIVGHLDTDEILVGTKVDGAEVLGVVEDISAILKGHVIDEVILAIPRAMISDVEKIAFVCEEEGVRFSVMADVFDVQVARMDLVNIGGIPLLTLYPVAQEEWKILVKRMMDLVICACFMPVVLAVTAGISIAIKLDTPGPVFYVQQRVGLNKRRFPMFKFRTMVVGSDRMQKEFEHLNEAKGPIFKIANDPRITRVGKLLRRTSLDELPQIFNVIRGEMSLVGPRPMSLRDVDLFDRGIQRKRFSVKPGITCLWQVSGRSLLPFSKWLELDLYYISNWSLGMDFKILLKTIPAVVRGTGAV